MQCLQETNGIRMDNCKSKQFNAIESLCELFGENYGTAAAAAALVSGQRQGTIPDSGVNPGGDDDDDDDEIDFDDEGNQN